MPQAVRMLLFAGSGLTRSLALLSALVLLLGILTAWLGSLGHRACSCSGLASALKEDQLEVTSARLA